MPAQRLTAMLLNTIVSRHQQALVVCKPPQPSRKSLIFLTCRRDVFRSTCFYFTSSCLHSYSGFKPQSPVLPTAWEGNRCSDGVLKATDNSVKQQFATFTEEQNHVVGLSKCRFLGQCRFMGIGLLVPRNLHFDSSGNLENYTWKY